MAKWASNNQKLSFKCINENDMAKWASKDRQPNSHLLYQKAGAGVDFLQNCDLPPPLKVFSGPDKTVLSSMNRICVDREDPDNNCEFDVYASGEQEKLELLRALRLSQTRARQAEKRAESLVKERDSMSKALFEDSLRLLAYRQWMRLLELQVSMLQSQWQKHKQLEEHLEEDGEAGFGVSWFVAFAFCLGVVGVGFAFGCSCLS